MTQTEDAFRMDGDQGSVKGAALPELDDVEEQNENFVTPNQTVTARATMKAPSMGKAAAAYMSSATKRGCFHGSCLWDLVIFDFVFKKNAGAKTDGKVTLQTSQDADL